MPILIIRLVTSNIGYEQNGPNRAFLNWQLLGWKELPSDLDCIFIIQSRNEHLRRLCETNAEPQPSLHTHHVAYQS